MSYDRRRVRVDHPAARTCVVCKERRKWRLPRASRTRQTPDTLTTRTGGYRMFPELCCADPNKALKALRILLAGE